MGRTVCTASNRHHAQRPHRGLCGATYFHPLQVDWIHNGALKEFHSGKVSLEQPLELQVGRLPASNAQLTTDQITCTLRQHTRAAAAARREAMVASKEPRDQKVAKPTVTMKQHRYTRKVPIHKQ